MFALFSRLNAAFFTFLLLLQIQTVQAFSWFSSEPNFGPLVKSQFSGSQANFVLSILQSTTKTNASILKQRSQLLTLQTQYEERHTLSMSQENWLKDLAADYHVSAPNFNYLQTWERLDKQVDIIPPSLVLAQAIQESGWGNSKLAHTANNYFGQECFSKGCGVGKGHGYKGHYYEMATFDSVDDAIQHYIHNLNTNKAYHQLWDLRYAQRRTEAGNMNSLALVKGLIAYSQLGRHYVNTIYQLIAKLHLTRFDTLASV